MLKTAGKMATSVDPDQMQHIMEPDLGLHCLLRHVSPNTLGKNGTQKRQCIFVTIMIMYKGDEPIYLPIYAYCAFNIFQKVVFCLMPYTDEVNLQTFVMI